MSLPGVIIVWLVAATESRPELTSRAMVHMDYWCSRNDVIWFADPERLRWFECEARRIKAIDTDAVLNPVSSFDSQHITERIRGIINQVRIDTYLNDLGVVRHADR